MSKADEMFKRLKYEKLKDEDEEIFFQYHGNKICFDHEFQYICIEDHFEEAGLIDMQELQAINEKCKELGWLDE